MRRRLLTTVLAITALSASVLLGAAPASANGVGGGAPYVAIGDSVASGNGLMPYDDTVCLRSKKAYPTVLAETLGGSVVSTACSGAGTAAVAAQAAGLAAQGVLGGATQLVTITAGVNDLPWIPVLGACSNLGSQDACFAALSGIGLAGPGIAGGVAQAIGIVRQGAPNALIIVTGYPKLFGSFSGTCSVGAAAAGMPMKFAQPQAGWLNLAVGDLNSAVQAGIGLYQQAFAAQNSGSTDPYTVYVDVTQPFLGHGLCDSGDRWISGLISGEPKDRGFHPNAAGQQAYAATIAASLAP